MNPKEYRNFSPLHWIVVAILGTMALGLVYWIAKILLLPAVIILACWALYRFLKPKLF